MMRTLFVANTTLFVALLGWMAATHAMRPEEITVVEVPARWETPRQAASDETAEPMEEEAQPETSSEDALHPKHARARDAFRAGDVRRAIRLISELIRKRPGDSVLLNDLGVYRIGAGALDEADTAFREAVRNDPSYGRAHYNLGTLLLRRGDPEGAIASLDSALELNPYDREARYNRAIARARLGDVDGAEADYRFLTESDRSDASVKARYNLGVLLARQGRLAEAIESLREALRIQPDHVDARYNTGVLLARTGMEEQAVEEYRKLLSIRPDHRGALLNMGALLMHQDRWTEAAERFRRLIATDPTNAAAYYNLGLCLTRQEDDAGAVDAFREAIRQSPEFAEAHYNLGLALGRLGDTEGAIDHFSRATALSPNEPGYHYNLALTLSHAERPLEAVAQYEAAIALDPEYFRAVYNLAVVRYREGDYAGALRDFERANQLRPESYSAAYNLGLTLLKLERPADGEQALRRALELDESVEARYNLGLSLGRQARLREAEEEYRAVLRMEPKHVPSIERLAETLVELGQDDAALERLALLQKLDSDDPTAFNTGLHYYRGQDYEKALRYFEVAGLGRGEVRRKTLNMKGVTLARLGRLDEAVPAYREALREFPESGAVRRNLAEALAREGDHEGAIEELEQARSSEPGDPRTLYLLGEQYDALGRREQASSYFRRALALAPDHQPARRALREIDEEEDIR